MKNSTTTLGDIVRILDGFYPPETAQSWDAVGLVSGDPHQAIESVHFAVDPSIDVIADAVDDGANLLITHHPLLLRGVKSVATTSGKGRAVTSAIVADLALYCAHTNADVATPGVNDALAAALELHDIQPLVEPEGQPLGRYGDLPQTMSLRAFSERLARVLPQAPVGIRVAGDPDAKVSRIAVLGGAGDGEFDAAKAAGADVYITADLRHHPVLEACEHGTDEKPLNIIDAGHWATEYVWLAAAAERLRKAVQAEGGEIDVHVSERCTDPWTFVITPDEAHQSTALTEGDRG